MLAYLLTLSRSGDQNRQTETATRKTDKASQPAGRPTDRPTDPGLSTEWIRLVTMGFGLIVVSGNFLIRYSVAC